MGDSSGANNTLGNLPDILEQILDNRVWANTPAHRLTFVNMKNKTHDTAIHVAAKYGQHAFIAKLVRLGAELDGLNAAHRTPLLVAIASTHHCARVDRPDYIETIRFLVSHRAHLGTLSAIGDTPLHFAVRQGDAQVAHLLLAAGADISARYGVDAPLHVAARMGNLAMVQLLLFTSRRGRPGAAAANPNAFNSAGDAVLHVAMRADHTAFVANIVEVLLQAGADASVRNSNGLNAWELALVKGLQEVHALFLNRGAG